MFRILIIISLTWLASAEAQQKYWIYPKDKMTDVNAFEHHAKLHDLEIIIQSNWLNAYTALIHQDSIASLKQSQRIKLLAPVRGKFHRAGSFSDHVRLGRALHQIKADTLISLGLTGSGVKIGIIDAGFLNADENNYLTGIVTNEQIAGYKNYIEPDLFEPFGGNSSNNDYHGTRVFQYLAGKSDMDYAGLASGATFYLARTDQADKEYHGEEDYWIAALEWMHGQGVRLVNSSLGYTDGFDDPDQDYLPEQVNGTFSAITRATEIAIKEKGMTIVLSAGNDGNKAFEIISIPADATGVIAVGASGFRYWNKLDYSSIGPAHMKAVKPEVSCYASGGTSFAAPIITGLVACLMEYRPELTNVEILKIIQESGHLYPYPNNYLGYGVPNVNKILELLSSSTEKSFDNTKLSANSSISIELPKSGNIMAFHKKDEYIVMAQEKLRWSDGKVEVIKHKGAQFTTVADGDSVWEIEWKE